MFDYLFTELPFFSETGGPPRFTNPEGEIIYAGYNLPPHIPTSFTLLNLGTGYKITLN